MSVCEIYRDRSFQHQLFADDMASFFAPGNELLAQALRAVDRRLFVPPGGKKAAYDDEIIPIRNGATISQPSLVVRMIDLMELKGKEKVLDIGTASGYTAALLSHCVPQVYSVEINPDLAERSKRRLTRLGYQNVEVVENDGVLGLPDQAPFDAILVSAAAKEVPSALTDQLVEGGRMVVPIGKDPVNAALTVVLKHRGLVFTHNSGPVAFVPLLSSAKGGWTEADLAELQQLKTTLLDLKLKAAGKTTDQFMQEVAERSQIPIEDVDLERHIRNMRYTETELELFYYLLNKREVA